LFKLQTKNIREWFNLKIALPAFTFDANRLLVTRSGYHVTPIFIYKGIARLSKASDREFHSDMCDIIVTTNFFSVQGIVKPFRLTMTPVKYQRMPYVFELNKDSVSFSFSDVEKNLKMFRIYSLPPPPEGCYLFQTDDMPSTITTVYRDQIEASWHGDQLAVVDTATFHFMLGILPENTKMFPNMTNAINIVEIDSVMSGYILAQRVNDILNESRRPEGNPEPSWSRSEDSQEDNGQDEVIVE